MITSVGELKFEWPRQKQNAVADVCRYGFLMQVTALFSEGLRINLPGPGHW